MKTDTRSTGNYLRKSQTHFRTLIIHLRKKRKTVHELADEGAHPLKARRTWWRRLVLPLQRLRRSRLQPPREHHGLGAGAVPDALQRSGNHEVGHLPLHLRRVAPSQVLDEV